jgi:hypothetical protein
MSGRIPTWVKSIFSVFFFIWAAVNLNYYGLENFLWLCDIANFLILAGLWFESPLIISSQAVSILIIQTIWTVDLICRAIFGLHITGGTEYMFNDAIPLYVRMFSLFHVVTPPFVLWSVWRLGYDRRGWILQSILAWIVLPVTYMTTSPELDINWVWGLSGKPQSAVDPLAFLFITMAVYPLLIYLPAHLLLKKLQDASGTGGAKARKAGKARKEVRCKQ